MGGSLTAFLFLIATGVVVVALTLSTPFVFRTYGDNAYMLMAAATGLAAIGATFAAERAPTIKTLWIIAGVAIFLRCVLLFTEPLLSTDIYRYVWDGKIQAAGINPYRFIPADPALISFRDAAIYPNINRADYAVTIYPPVAQMFFFLVTRFGETVITMKLALLLCEAATVAIIVLLLRRIGRPLTRVVAYAWHPLPLWEIANNGHIDALMIVLMMLGIWLAILGRPLPGSLSITLGTLAKPFAILALPALWRPWDWKMPLLFVVALAACYSPYLSVGWGVLGYFTTGYLPEENFDTGGLVWLLAIWRRLFGTIPGDYVVYLAGSALLLASLALFAGFRRSKTDQTTLADINMLLLAFLFLLSPNFSWYFLVITPFVALLGGAPLWAITVGAALLQEEAGWDQHVHIVIRKSVHFGVFLIACGYVGWRVWKRKTGKVASE